MIKVFIKICIKAFSNPLQTVAVIVTLFLLLILLIFNNGSLKVLDTVMIVQASVMIISIFAAILEYKRLRKETKVSNYAQQINLLKELRMLRIINPELSKTLHPGDPKDFSLEKTQSQFFNLIVLSVFELTYMKYKEGVLDKDTWYFWKDSLEKICRKESIRKMLLEERHTNKVIYPKFLDIVKDIIATQKREDKVKASLSAID